MTHSRSAITYCSDLWRFLVYYAVGLHIDVNKNVHVLMNVLGM